MHGSLSLWLCGGSPTFRLPAHNLSFLNMVIPSTKFSFFFQRTFTPLSAIYSLLALDEVCSFVPHPSLSLILSVPTWLCSAFHNMQRPQQSRHPSVGSQSWPTRILGPATIRDMWRASRSPPSNNKYTFTLKLFPQQQLCNNTITSRRHSALTRGPRTTWVDIPNWHPGKT